MDTTTLLIGVIVVLVVALLGLIITQRRNSAKIRERFGPEYDHALEEYGDKRKAEAELEAREKRVASFDIRSLSPEEHHRFAEEWRRTQAHFVDQPSEAAADADRLVKEVMQARGYPMGNFEQRAADISVDHPHVVTNYRSAHEIALNNRQGKASTEDLRQAMVHYRSLFDDLLGAGERVVEREKEMVR